jgi:hypothetical protein
MKRGLLALLALAVLSTAAWLALDAPTAGAQSRSRKAHGSITEGLDCGMCHTTAGWKSLSDGQAKGFDHARTGFPLTGRHQQVACTGCHKPNEQVTRQCNACHADEHQGRLGQDCDSCHSSETFHRVKAFERHRLTRLPLTGMHALAECTDCHRRTTDGQWNAVPADCFACHEAEYRRKNLHPSHVGGVGTPPSPPFSRDCAQCHRATGWSPAVVSPSALRAMVAPSVLGLTVAPERHELAFPISHGAHRAAGCDDCHVSQSVPQAVRCTGCHAHNPVALHTQHKRAPSTLSDASCLSCHPGGARR